MSLQISDAILKKAQQGDLKAFEEIVFKFQRRIFSYILKYTNSKEDAEDITQETFFKLYKNLRKYNYQTKFSTWLFSIAKNATYDFLRQKRRRPELYILDGDSGNAIYLNCQRKDHKDEKIDLGLAMGVIKPAYQKVLTLFYHEGFNYQEISQKLGMPLNTVKTYLFRAKLSMRQELKYG